jgi:hypothetical protein
METWKLQDGSLDVECAAEISNQTFCQNRRRDSYIFAYNPLKFCIFTNQGPETYCKGVVDVDVGLL